MKGWWRILGSIVLLVVLFLAVVWFLLWNQAAQSVAPAAPDIGDVASAFNDIVSPILAALAFLGLVITALMQREELSLQRDELKESNQAFKRTAEAQEASGKALAAQVDTARIAAQLSASTTLLGYYSQELDLMRRNMYVGSISKDEVIKLVKNNKERVERLLSEVEATTQNDSSVP
jgi:signal transduction histidine kinase